MKRSPDTATVLTGEGKQTARVLDLPFSERFQFRANSLSVSMKKGSSNNNAYHSKNIAEPNSHDVLCGRGANISNFVGNMRWRDLIKARKEEYVRLPKSTRGAVTESIVRSVRSLEPPGRFLQRDPTTGLWFDIGDQKANEKTAQALREGAPSLRRKLKASLSPIRKTEESKKQVKRSGSSGSFSTSSELAARLSDPAMGQVPASCGGRGRSPPATRLMIQVGATAGSSQESLPLWPAFEDHHARSGSVHAKSSESSLEFEPLPLEYGQVFSGTVGGEAEDGVTFPITSFSALEGLE